MKSIILTCSAAIFAAAPASAIQQAPMNHGPQPMTRAQVQAMVQQHFTQADTNRDGFVTRAEADARGAGSAGGREDRRGEMFDRLDSNRDGSISRTEWNARPQRERWGPEGAGPGEHRGMHGAMMGGVGGRFFDMADSNKDAKLSLQEALAKPLEMFDRADANRDGTLSASEREAAMQAFRGQRQQGRSDR